MRFNTHRTEESVCSKCGNSLDACTGLNLENQPEPGDVSICGYCGQVMIFGVNLTLREPTLQEQKSLCKDSAIAHAQSMIFAMNNSPELH